jgi:hypothetical protein
MSVVKYETRKCTMCASAEALNVRAGGTCSNHYDFKG